MLGDVQMEWLADLLRGTPAGLAMIACMRWALAELKVWRGTLAALVKALQDVGKGLQGRSEKGGDNGKGS